MLYFIAALLVATSLLFMRGAKVESITFNKATSRLTLLRVNMLSCSKKRTRISLNKIKNVYAARRGVKAHKANMTSYQLIVVLESGHKLKILETKDIKKIKRKLIMLRKFLEMDF